MSHAETVTVTAHRTVELVRAELPPLAPDRIEGASLVSLLSPGTEMNYGFLGEEGFPRQIGYATVLRVEAVGAEASARRPGDVLLSMRPHASRVQALVSWCEPVPDGLDPAVAAVARLAAVGMATLLTTGARPGDRALVTGLGPVGLLAAALFQDHGYRVRGVDPQEHCRANAGALSVESSPSVAELPAEWRRGVDLVVECSGHERGTLEAMGTVRTGGEVSLVGVPWRQRTEDSAHAVLDRIFRGYVTVRSGWEWQLPREGDGFRVHGTCESMRRCMAWVARRSGDLTPLIERRSPDEAQAVYEDLHERRIARPFVVLDWAGRRSGPGAGEGH